MFALADDDERDRAVATVGRPYDLIAQAMLDALPAWERWRDEIAALVARSDSLAEASAALTEWASRAATDEDIASSIYTSSVQADLGGQLFVRAVEVPEASPIRALDVEVTPSFLSLPFDEAIAAFLERRIVTPQEFRALSDAARTRAFTATQLASDELRQRAYDAILRALESGTTYDDFARDLASGEATLGIEPSSPGYLETVYRTNVQAAYGAGRLRQIQSPAVQAARPFVQYRTAGDSRVRASHARLNGLVFRQSDPNWPTIAPPNGFNCYTGDTPVSGRILAAIRTRYSGPLLKLTTKSGRRLSVTPNHPLATADGFVAAGSIHEGQHVLSHGGHVRLPVVGAIDPEHGPPMPVEDLFRALAERHGALTLRVVADDLHGDAVGGDGHVDVVAADRMLLDNIQSEAAQDGREPVLVLPDLRLGQEDRDSVAPLGCIATSGATRSGPRTRALPLNESAVALDGGPLETLCLGPASALHAALGKDAGNDPAADAEALGQLLLGAAGEVFSDEVVSVELDPGYHGYIFDVTTDQGWAVASGIVISNCRCAVVVRRARDVDESSVVDASGYLDAADTGFASPPTVTLT